jgi:hypothetical protein
VDFLDTHMISLVLFFRKPGVTNRYNLNWPSKGVFGMAVQCGTDTVASSLWHKKMWAVVHSCGFMFFARWKESLIPRGVFWVFLFSWWGGHRSNFDRKQTHPKFRMYLLCDTWMTCNFQNLFNHHVMHSNSTWVRFRNVHGHVLLALTSNMVNYIN